MGERCYRDIHRDNRLLPRGAASVAKAAANDSGKIAKEQTNALMTAAKANALASRIHAYDLQIAIVDGKIQDGKVRGIAPMPLVNLVKEADQLKRERKHLIVWLDRQTDALGVGLGSPCDGSDYVPPQKENPQRASGQANCGGPTQ